GAGERERGAVQGEANHHRGTEATKHEKGLHSGSWVADFLRLCRRSRAKQITTEAQRTPRTKNSFIRNPVSSICSASAAGPGQSKSPQRHRGHKERKTASFGIRCCQFSPPLPQVQGKANHD